VTARWDCAVLAAGASRRLGRPKQLLPVGGRTLVRHVVERACASRAARVAVVVGAHALAVRAALDGAAVTVLENPEWEEGLASSIRAAARWAAGRRAAALAIVLADQPEITPHHLNRLAAEHGAGAAAAGSAYRGVLGVPAVFDAALFPALLALSGDRGAAALLAETRAATVPWPAGAVDIDTEADVVRLRAADLTRQSDDR